MVRVFRRTRVYISRFQRALGIKNHIAHITAEETTTRVVESSTIIYKSTDVASTVSGSGAGNYALQSITM